MFVVGKAQDGAFVSVYTEHICEPNHIPEDVGIAAFNAEKFFFQNRPK